MQKTPTLLLLLLFINFFFYIIYFNLIYIEHGAVKRKFTYFLYILER